MNFQIFKRNIRNMQKMSKNWVEIKNLKKTKIINNLNGIIKNEQIKIQMSESHSSKPWLINLNNNNKVFLKNSIKE